MYNKNEGGNVVANPIQGMRIVYDTAKAARDNDQEFSDEDIQLLLKRLISDESLIPEYSRFAKGYAVEDLFMRIYSLLPWVKIITPLGQEQFPEKSKETLQVPDYEIVFEAGSNTIFSNVLVEVKLIDGDKQTFELQKYKYDVLKEYSREKKEPILYALFWRKRLMWTINVIDSFSEKSSAYKISFEEACADDLSAIFGDYTYIFRKQCYRKSRFSKDDSIDTEYVHSHEKYGRTVYEALSIDGKNYDDLCMLEPVLLDCAFDFKEISHRALTDTDTEVLEEYEKGPYVYKLSSLLLAYLLKIYCLDKNDMYCKDNLIVRNVFHIVDTVRRKCGGEKFYLMPYHINDITKEMIEIQFGKVPRIFNVYLKEERREGLNVLASHDG